MADTKEPAAPSADQPVSPPASPAVWEPPPEFPQLCRYLAEASAQPMVAVEGLTRLVRYVNPAFRQLLGKEDQHLLGRRFEEAVPEGLGNTCAAMLHRVFTNGTSEALNEQEHGPDVWADGILAAKGRTHWSYLAWAILGHDHKPAGVMIQVTDATEHARFRKVAAAVNEALLVSGVHQHEMMDEAAVLNKLVSQNERRLRTMADAMPQLATMATADGTVQWYNKRWYEYTGATPEQLQGWGWQSVIDPKVLPAVLENWKASVTTGKPFEMVFPLRGKDGMFRAFLSRAEALKDADGNIIQWFGTTTDIEEVQRATEAMRQSEERFRALVTASSDVVYRMSADWSVSHPFDGRNFVHGSDAPRRDWLTKHIHPDDQSRVAAAVEKAIRGKGVFELEHRVRRVDETWGWTFSRAVPLLNAAGEITEWFGAASNVTERKEAEEALRTSEERFRAAIDAVSDIIWSNNAHGQMQGEQSAWAAFTGQCREDYQGFGWSNAVHPEDAQPSIDAWRLAVAERRTFEFEHRLRRHDGQWRVCSVRAVPVMDPEGKIREWVGVHTDITERKAFDRERDGLMANEQAARMEMETANRAKDVFLATLSHELRTPLNAMVGWMSILRRPSCTEEDVREGLDVIDRNTQVQMQLIDDVLDMSRIVSGKVSIEAEPCDLAEVIRAALDTVRLAAKAKNIELVFDLDPESGAGYCDPVRMQQTVWNLLNNAVKFTPRNGKVTVTLSRPPLPDRSVTRITVADSGMGIAPAFLPYVFDRFRQADGSTRRKFGGLGLGLSIVKYIVEAHGGTISVQSEGEGKGATFIIDLPVHAIAPSVIHEYDGRERATPPNAQHENGATEHVTSPPPLRLDGVSVLVVDDEPDARRLVGKVLASAGAVVSTAGSVPEALELIAVETPDVLVSDIAMPGEDGYDLLRQVRAAGHSARSLPAVALTAFAGEAESRKALLGGFQVHVPKPVDPHDLIIVVGNLIGRTGPSHV